MLNGTMLQYFQWELPADGKLWKRAARDAFHLRRLGFTALWLSPAYKGNGGINDVGYGVYDTYDLGEFAQKGTRRTKYGTREEYLAAIRVLHMADIQVLPDIVLNHRMGADALTAWIGTTPPTSAACTGSTARRGSRMWTRSGAIMII